MDTIYLDHAATAPVRPEVGEALADACRAAYANPASQHHAGRRARQALELARETIAKLVGADVTSHRGERVVFTSGGTEANNLALFGLAGDAPGHAIVSAVEHPSVRGPADELARRGWEIEQAPVDSQGVIELGALEAMLRPETRFAALMLVNNETGVIQPVAEAAAMCRARGVPLHCDAVQAAGKIPLDFRGLSCSTMALAAHKFHGPRGVGALVVREGVELKPLHYGGFQQEGLRPGTEDVALPLGMAHALELALAPNAPLAEQVEPLRDDFEERMLQVWPKAVINGRQASRAPHISNVSFPGVDRQALWLALDLAKVACSTGSACASGSSEPSPVLLAMGCSPEVVAGALRFSFGLLNRRSDVPVACERILNCLKHLQSLLPPRPNVPKTV